MTNQNRKSLSDKTFTVLAITGDLTLPVIGVLCFVASLIFDISGIEYVLGVILLLISIIGFVLLFSSSNYKKTHTGEIVITMMPDGKQLFSLELETDPNELVDRDTVSFRVSKDNLAD